MDHQLCNMTNLGLVDSPTVLCTNDTVKHLYLAGTVNSEILAIILFSRKVFKDIFAKLKIRD